MADPRACIVCAEPFTPSRSDNTICSPACRIRRAHEQRRSRPDYAEWKRQENLRYRKAHPESMAWNDTKKAAYHRRRARKKMGDAGERIIPADVFERDGWRCGICGRTVNLDLAWPHPKSASLDHVVPLSKGGTHTLANVQCSHLDCNTAKHVNTGGAGDQLRLIG